MGHIPHIDDSNITYLGQTAPSRTARYPLALPLQAQVLLRLAPLLGGWLAPQRGLLRKFGCPGVPRNLWGANRVFGIAFEVPICSNVFSKGYIFGCPNEAVDKHNHVNLRTLHMVIWSMSQENGVRVPQQQVICLEVIPVIPFRQFV